MNGAIRRCFVVFALLAGLTTTTAMASSASTNHQPTATSKSSLQSHDAACPYADVGPDQKAQKDCGADLTGPGTLALTPCTQPGQSKNLCTKDFSLGLTVTDGSDCFTCTFPPALVGFILSKPGVPIPNSGTMYSGAWCNSGGQDCTAAQSTSGPHYIEIYAASIPTFPEKAIYNLEVSQGESGFPIWFAYLNIILTKGPVTPEPKNLLSASIKLATAQGAQIAGAAVAIGQQLVATVKLSVSSKATGPVTGITASPSLASAPTTVLSIQGGPSPPFSSGGISINPGSSVTYKQNVTVVSLGTAVLSMKATGTAPDGSSVQASDSLTARLGQPLSITIKWLKRGEQLSTSVKGKAQLDTLRLADADDGEVADYVTAQVVVKNTSKVTQTNVNFNGVPSFSYATKAQVVRTLPVKVIAGPTPNGTIGTLAPGQTAKPVNFVVRVSNNGGFVFTAQVLSGSEGGTATNVSEGTSTLTVLPTKLLWLSLHKLQTSNDGTTDTAPITPGAPVLIGGTVTNRSLTQSIDLAPLLATVTGDADGGDLVDQASTPEPDGVELPFAGTIGPGDTIDVIGEVGTSMVPGSRASVTYSPTGTVEAADGSTSDLTDTDVGSDKGSLPVPIELSVSDPVVPPSDIKTEITYFTNATFYTAAKWSYLGFVGLGETIEHPIDALHGAANGFGTLVVAGGSGLYQAGSVVTSVLLLGTVGQSWTNDERVKFANDVLADFEASHVVKLTEAVKAAVRKAGDDALIPFEQAVQTGDYNQVATLAGTGFGAGLSTAGNLMVSDIVFQKLVLGLGYSVKGTLKGASQLAVKASDSVFGQELSLASALKNSRVNQTIGKGLKGIVAGQDLLLNGANALTKIYGLTLDQVSALQKFCAENQIIVAVRSRSERAAQLIRDGLAIGKNEVIKLKNVDAIDVQYLGYNADQLNTVVWAQPVPIDYVTAQLAASGASALEREVVLARFSLREEEWANASINKVINDAKQSKTIDWSFNGSGNGAPAANKTATRSFGLESSGNPIPESVMKNRTYEQVLVGNKPLVEGKVVTGTKLVAITQDVDMMALLSANGQLVSSELRAKFYTYLSDIIGIEHGETPSWILDGEIIFQKKAKQLADAIPGGEALAVFGPDGSVTAGFYNPALTTFNNVKKTGSIFFDGGYNSSFYLSLAKVRASLGNFANAL